MYVSVAWFANFVVRLDQPIWRKLTVGACLTQVAVKWQKEIFKDLEVDTSQPPVMFKMQLFSLTGVPPERQKILVKGGQLKDDGDWAKVALKEGQTLMMMGTAEKVASSTSTRC